MSAEQDPSFTPKLHSYEPPSFRDEVFKYMNIAVIVAAASAGGTLIGSYPELASSSVETQEDPTLTKAKEKTALDEKFDRWLADRDQALNVYQMPDPRYTQGVAAREQLAGQLGLHFFKYDPNPNRSPKDTLEVFTNFVAQYGMQVEVSDNPQEKPTPEQLLTERAKVSLNTFGSYLESMPKEYITDVAAVKRVVLFAMPAGSEVVDYAPDSAVHMSINFQGSNEAMGHEIAHNADAQSHGEGTADNDPEFEATAALPSETDIPLSDEDYKTTANETASKYMDQGEERLPAWCHAQQGLANKAQKVLSASNYKPNARERKAEITWRLLDMRDGTMFDPAKPHLYDAARLELERIDKKSPAVAEWIARTQKPVTDYCHPKRWD